MLSLSKTKKTDFYQVKKHLPGHGHKSGIIHQERKLHEVVNIMRTKLKWLQEWSNSKKEKKQQAINNLRYNIWKMIGLRKYGFAKGALEEVIENHRKIATVPRGFFYPELHFQRKEPIELQKVAMSKLKASRRAKSLQ